jgi:hypothetical protein
MLVRYDSALTLLKQNCQEDFLCGYADESVQELTHEGPCIEGSLVLCSWLV